MIEIDRQLFKVYSSLEKLESLDKHYYKKENYNINSYRYLIKSDLLFSNKFDWFNLLSKKMQNYIKNDFYTLPVFDEMLDRVGMLNIITSYRLKDSYRKKTIRLKKRINKLFELDNLFFITFTFDNKKFRFGDVNNIKYDTLRKYVRTWLNKYCVDYVGNIDFGGENGRVHFHCIVSSIDTRIEGVSWKYGALNFKKIHTKNNRQLALYVNKLCSHALKESTHAQYLLYPKKSLRKKS